MADRVILLSIPQLRHRDVTPGALASLEALSARGAMAELEPAFPGLSASSFATLVTGTGPYQHGIIGDAYFDREARRVVGRPIPDAAVTSPKLWDRLRAERPGARSLVWFAPNARDAAVDLLAWSEPESASAGDGGLRTAPEGLAAGLLKQFGPLPCAAPGCEPPRLETSTWILRTAAAVLAAEAPELAIVRVPYLGQVARRFGPDGREASRSVRELEAILGPFLAALPREVVVLAVTESVSTPVSEPVYVNRILRSLGLLALADAPGGGLDVDLDHSAAFALADHQLAHIYLNDPSQAAAVASAFSGPHADGVAQVAPGAGRAALGLDHPRAGDVVLVAEPDRWFAPHWWTTPAEAPRDPRRGSGLARTLGPIPLDPAHVRGSLGAPAANPDYCGVAVVSSPGALAGRTWLAAREVADLVARAWTPDPSSPNRSEPRARM